MDDPAVQPADAAAAQAVRRRRPPPEVPLPGLSRGRLALAVGALGVAGSLTLATHFQLFPWPLHGVMRDWALHSCGVLATALATGLCLGLHRAHRRGARRALAAIALGVPLAVTLLHELGQWLWPEHARDAFDALRDCALNVLGATVAGALLLAQRPAPGRGSAAGADG
jgi:hypothetical protein